MDPHTEPGRYGDWRLIIGWGGPSRTSSVAVDPGGLGSSSLHREQLCLRFLLRDLYKFISERAELFFWGRGHVTGIAFG